MLDVDLSIRDVDGQVVVALRGEFDLADTPSVASHLIAAVAACGPSVIVDLAGLDGIGYSGLSVLLRIRKWTRGNGGDLLLAAPQQPVRQILKATGLIDVFSVYPCVEEAAKAMSPAQPRSPAVPPQRARRPARHSPVRHSPVRPPPTPGKCRLRYMARDPSDKWCVLRNITVCSAWI
jgi:anti-sigma B factor antagonist